MRFEKIELDLSKLEVVDIIASSPEEPTQQPTEVTTKHDPYADDKW